MSAVLLGAALVAAAFLLGGGRRSARRPRGRRPGALAPPGTASATAPPPSALTGELARWREASAEPASVRGTADVARASARLAALLRAGVPAPAAWQHLAAVSGPAIASGPATVSVPAAGARAGGGGPVSLAVRRAAHASRTGGDVAAALRGTPSGGGAESWAGWGAPGAGPGTGPTAGPVAGGAARPRGRDEPVHRALAAVAAAWQVAERSGAPPAEVLERLAAGLTADRDAALARESALAAPRSTAVVLLVLPLAGLGLGVLLGVDPVGVLLGTQAGRGCLLVGVLSTAGGWWWTRRLVRRAERTP